MDNKQIIIDGCDVSGCNYLVDRFSERTDYCCNKGGILFKCCNNPDCYYKQLKRKEQECEELKDINAELDVDLQNARDSYVALDLMRVGEYNALVDDYNKLKRTLTEIKEIAENVQSFVDSRLEDDVFTEMNKILQKISEVIDESN